MERVIAQQEFPDNHDLLWMRAMVADKDGGCDVVRVERKTSNAVMSMELQFAALFGPVVTDEILLGIVLARLKARDNKSPAMIKARANLEHAIAHVRSLNLNSGI